MPRITVKAAVVTDDQAATVAADLADGIGGIAATLPPGYSVELGGSVEESRRVRVQSRRSCRSCFW
ncbi:MAG: hypothetical protein P1U75_12020 [Antarcticimicrobium sp.]|nr:hypothetical protein [Antarcticimicrobium sp.]